MPENKKSSRDNTAQPGLLQHFATTEKEKTMKEATEVKFQEELQKMEYEPMNDTEKRLVRNALILGVGLLVIFYFVSDWLFPGAHG